MKIFVLHEDCEKAEDRMCGTFPTFESAYKAVLEFARVIYARATYMDKISGADTIVRIELDDNPRTFWISETYLNSGG